MKKLYTILAAVLITATTFAQAPEKMSYQAVVRDSGDALVTNQAVGMQMSILQTTATGTAVYVETQTPTTNVNGLVTLEIGTGTVVSGDFTTIDWSADSYFIKTEADPTGGTSYTITGTSQLSSVPYALHAKTAGSVTETQTLADVIAIGNTADAQIKNVTDPTDAQDAATKAYVDALNNRITALETQPTYNVNTFYAELGGYVIEINTDGTHGLVTAMQDQGTSNWYNANDLLSNATNHNVNGAKFKDWRLPTKREINLMYLNRASVSIGGFVPDFYWSSTEDGDSNAWLQNFENGNQTNGYKNYKFSVRAVRAF